MSEITLTKTRLIAGIWEGVLTHKGEGNFQPKLRVTHLDQPLEDVTAQEDQAAGHWIVRVPVPASLISDGLQTFVIREAVTDEVLASFALLAGDALAEDIRAEMNLLRAELDMLKQAFRRHCVETT